MLLNGTLHRLRDQTVNNTLFIENEDGNANLIATVCVYVLLFNNLNEMLKDIRGKCIKLCTPVFWHTEVANVCSRLICTKICNVSPLLHRSHHVKKNKRGWGLVEGAWPIVARRIYHHLC